MNRILQGGVLSLGARVFELAEHSSLVRDWVLRPAVMLLVDSAVAAWRRGGTAAWDRWHLPLLRAAGRSRAAYLQKKMAIDPRSARQLGSIHDYEDPLFGITGHWADEGERRAVRVETECPIGARLYPYGCTDFCRVLVHAFEEETIRAMNPGYRLEPLVELLSSGDARCIFVHTLPKE
jgi:hypothetical protein